KACVLCTMLVIAVVAARQSFPQSGSESENPPAKPSRPGSRTAPAKPPEDDHADAADDDQQLIAPPARQATASADRTTKPARKPRGATTPAIDPSLNEPEGPVHRQTINRGALGEIQLVGGEAADSRWRPAPTDSTPRTFALAKNGDDPGALPAEPTLE